MHAQPGIFALGTPEHCFLELDLAAGADAAVVIRSAAEQQRELSTTAGVNVVLGVRPSVWASCAPGEHVPDRVRDWDDPITGPDGFSMPATPHDLWLWVAGGDRTAVFDSTRAALRGLGDGVRVASETTGWTYRHDRDLTGFVDGTENPPVFEAPSVVGREAGPGAGSSVVLFQLWPHDTDAWERLPDDAQERVIGRTKPDSTELEDLPPDSHVARSVLEVDGEELDIFRRNVAYGGVTGHGTVFVGFSFDQWRLHEMLRRIAGVTDGIRCALTRYTQPTTGAYYVVPSVEAVAALA